MRRHWWLLSLLWTTVEAQKCDGGNTPPLEIRGKHFFNSETGEYFPVKGIAYYPRPNEGINNVNNFDFYHDEWKDVWERDIPFLEAANVNLIRIYAVDPGKDHDGFFCALQKAGIYVMVGLAAGCLNCAITKDPVPDCYPAELRTRGEYIINVFAKYDNVLGFSAGNEIGLLPGVPGMPEVNAGCQKKFIRDMREYIAGCDTIRDIPVGLSLADLDLDSKLSYYSCRSDPSDIYENTDWIGLNQYRHCDASATDPSALGGYQRLRETFQENQVPCPMIFTEFGCLNAGYPTVSGFEGQRTFLQVETMFLPEFLEEVTGGIVFEYSTERANALSDWPFREHDPGRYGIGYFSPEGCDDIDVPCNFIPFPQFNNLAQRYGAVSVTANDLPATDGRPAVTQCPAQFPPLSDFVWPSDSVDAFVCPEALTLTCPLEPGCAPTPGPQPTAAPTRTPAPSGIARTALPTGGLPELEPLPSLVGSSAWRLGATWLFVSGGAILVLVM